jgi:tetratricopeptide (TPR) repeat protein
MTLGDSATTRNNAPGIDSAPLHTRARAALPLLQAGDIPLAESICLQILASHPQYFHALHLLGIAALQPRDFLTASQRLQAAIEADPAQPDAHSNLAVALIAEQRAHEALASCNHALSLKLKPEMERSFQPRRYRAGSRPQEALESYDRAIALAPSLVAAHLGRGIALYQQGLAAESLQSFDRVLSLDPARADAFNNRGNALLELDRPPCPRTTRRCASQPISPKR